MVKIKVGKHNYYMDGYLMSNLDKIKSFIRKDNDYPLIIEGYEGSGKSTIACQIAKYIDPKFSIKDIAFDGEQFLAKIKTAKLYSVVLFDEAGTALFSRETQEEFNKILIKAFMIMRIKKLFVIIVIPSFFFIDSYIRIHRGRSLIKVYTRRNRKTGELEKGFFKLYNRTAMNIINNKKNYLKANPSFWGKFTKYNPVDKYKEISEEWKFNFNIKSKKDKKIEKLNKLYQNTLEQRNRLILGLIKAGVTREYIANSIMIKKTSVSTIAKSMSLTSIKPIIQGLELRNQQIEEDVRIKNKLITLLGNIEGLPVTIVAEYLELPRYKLDKIIKSNPINKHSILLKRLSEKVAEGKKKSEA